MNVVSIGLPGLGMGILIGFCWWIAYQPSAYSMPVLVVVHGAAGLIFQLLIQLVIRRWRSLGSVLLGLVGSLFLGPLLVVMPFAWGWLAGVEGLLVILMAIALGGAFGLEVGRRGLFGVLAVVLVIVCVVGVNAYLIGTRDEPLQLAREDAVERFPDQALALIGIDGADFQVVSPMIERGELPNLASLIQRGRSGVLRSIEPTLSPVVWTTLFSGHPADVHGLKDWATSDNRNRRVPMLWDVFGAHGRTSVVVNVPGTWPPAPVVGGRVLSGFPIPGIVSGGRGQLMGTVLSSDPMDTGSVTTIEIERVDAETFRFEFPFASPRVMPRLTGVTHPLIDAAARDRLIPVDEENLSGWIRLEKDGAMRVESDQLDRPLRLARGTWSGWLRVELPSGFAMTRAHAIEAGPERVRIYFTPAFQDPLEPRYPFEWNVGRNVLEALPAPYVVEGVGWRAHRDERVAPLLPEMLSHIEWTHASAALTLLAAESPNLFAYVITLTDRIQHPFWRDHEPAPFAPDHARHSGLNGADPVEDAYRVADRVLGNFLKALPFNALIFVVSDHGVAPAVERGEGGHRSEGIWIAAGPQVAAGREAVELSILDIVPTALQCLGAPTSVDMPGEPRRSVCRAMGAAPKISSYTSATGVRQSIEAQEEVTIDAAREEQLRSLGYIE